jgi:hypothetical protein
MLIKDLIHLLEEEYAKQDKLREHFGEPSIMIDKFEVGNRCFIRYAGISPDIEIERTADGVYAVLKGFK